MFPYLQSVQVRLARASLAKNVLHGMRMLTVAKLMPLGNSVVAMQAGALDVNRLRFLLADAFASVVYAAVYAALGFTFHNQLEQVVMVLQELGRVSLALIVAATVEFLVHWFFKQHRKKELPPDPEPSKAEARICHP